MEKSGASVQPSPANPLTPIAEDKFDAEIVTIDDEGKIERITMAGKDIQLSRLIEDNIKTAQKLFATARLLKKDTSNEEYLSVAKKMIRLFNLSREPSEKYASDCETLATSLMKQTAHFMQRQRETETAQLVTRYKSQGNIATSAVFEGMLNHIEDAPYNSFGPDVFRHIMQGIVEVKEGDRDLFMENEVRMFDLMGDEYPDDQKIELCANRIRALLLILQDKVLPPVARGEKQKVEDVVERKKLSNEVRELVDEIRDAKLSDGIPQIIEKKIAKWRTGSDNEKKLAELLAPLNQIFYVTKLQNIKSLLSGDPQLKDLKFSFENKRIEIHFDQLKRVIAEISVDIKPENSDIKFKQTLTLTASLNQLNFWNCSIQYALRSPKEELPKAQKLQAVIEAQGDRCQLTVLS